MPAENCHGPTCLQSIALVLIVSLPLSSAAAAERGTITLPGTKKPRLAEVTVKTTKKKDRWGAKIRGWK